MHAWRLATRPFAETLDGGGNRERGARWNSGGGRGVVYCSENLATCVLEALVNFGPAQRRKLPPNFRQVLLDIPDDAGVEELTAQDLPDDPDAVDESGRTWTQARGDRWLRAGRALVMRVPSLVVPVERNLLLDPQHPEMKRVRIVANEPFRFDDRLAHRR